MTFGKKNRSAFTLVEVVMSLGIAGFCLVSVLGLLSVGLNTNNAALQQTGAAAAAASIVADLRATPPSVPTVASQTSPRFKIKIPSSNPTATALPMETLYLATTGTASALNANGAGNSNYRATLWFTPPGTVTAAGAGSIPMRSATMVRILITWPALADLRAGNMPAGFTGSFETVIALDRN